MRKRKTFRPLENYDNGKHPLYCDTFYNLMQKLSFDFAQNVPSIYQRGHPKILRNYLVRCKGRLLWFHIVRTWSCTQGYVPSKACTMGHPLSSGGKTNRWMGTCREYHGYLWQVVCIT